MAALIALPWSAWVIAVMIGLAAFLFEHQGSYVEAGNPRSARAASRIDLRDGAARTNTPLPVFATIWLYHWFWLLPWVFVLWYGFETTWWRAVAALVIGFLFRLFFAALARATGLLRNAWMIAWVGIPLIPFLLGAMVAVTLGRL
jgi:hypothetical protein